MNRSTGEFSQEQPVSNIVNSCKRGAIVRTEKDEGAFIEQVIFQISVFLT